MNWRIIRMCSAAITDMERENMEGTAMAIMGIAATAIMERMVMAVTENMTMNAAEITIMAAIFVD